MAISVSIVEDNRETRESLVALIARDPKLRFVASYATGEAALRGIEAQPPDVALVDINLPGMSGIDCVSRLKAKRSQVQILMLTTYEDRELIFNSLRAGARGYLLKNLPYPELLQAIEQVHGGGAPMSMQVARKVVDFFHQRESGASDVDKLTTREHEILALLAKGFFYKEIGQTLGISLSTVSTHLQHIYEKLHVQSRTEAAAKFLAPR
jgi:DNA-binding NarL/FixJ family response regulator